MSGLRAQHLERRCGIFGLRVRVPDDIRPLVGMVEVRRSLRTYDPFRARVQSALSAARLFEVFETVRENQTTLTTEAVQQMIATGLRDALANMLGLAAPTVPIPAAPAAVHHIGPTLEEAIDAYLCAKRNEWTKKTYASRQTRLGYLREHLGDDTRLSQITAFDIRSFRDAVLRLRRHTGRSRPTTFGAKQTESAEHRIDPRTAALIFEPCLAFFRWARFDEGYLTANPAEGVRVALPKKQKGKKSRRPFTADELRLLFSAPLFTGCASRSRRFVSGQKILRDGRYWIPILGHYSGCRLGELVQLHLADVHLAGPIPYIEITEAVSGSACDADAKHVKSDAGVRKVPLHPDVITLGFGQFVASRGRGRGGSKRLFHEIVLGADGQASTTFSKYFGRLLDKVGLSDPALVFHSFRHGAEDAFRDALVPQYVIDRIIGHSDGSTSAKYGNGISLDVAYDAVKNMRLTLFLPPMFDERG